MNKQLKIKGNLLISRGIEWTDYTWPVSGGCFHGCEWKMPDGTIAECYAKTTAESIAQKAYPEGFEHEYWRPENLNQPLGQKTPAKIFVDSMSDLMGHWLPEDHIQAVLNVCRKAKWHTFQLLTKNPVRLSRFDLPENLWTGFSTPPDFMWGKALSPNMKERMFVTSLKAITECNAKVKFISVEPLSWDISQLLLQYGGAINWLIIGAASKDGKTHHQPDVNHLEKLLDVCDTMGIPVFFKGNLDYRPHREYWPVGYTTFDEHHFLDRPDDD